MSREAVSKYLHEKFPAIRGWCSPHLWTLIQPIADHQAAAGIHNPVAEIGVYEGKFFIGLLATKDAGSGNYAIDVFDLQQFNLDGAGEGSLAALTANIQACGYDLTTVEVFKADSMALTNLDTDKIRSRSGGFSFFSVDGCHLVEHTINDVKFAMATTIPEGVIFVDDYTNPDWPGVQEGMNRLYHCEYPRFVPLACAHNKLLLCHISHHATYLKLLTEKLEAAKIVHKNVKRFGYENITVHLNPSSNNYFAD